ncbi:MAG: hypothetical protein MHM6MM_000601 [Cercozoa sp. M6MM]
MAQFDTEALQKACDVLTTFFRPNVVGPVREALDFFKSGEEAKPFTNPEYVEIIVARMCFVYAPLNLASTRMTNMMNSQAESEIQSHETQKKLTHACETAHAALTTFITARLTKHRAIDDVFSAETEEEQPVPPAPRLLRLLHREPMDLCDYEKDFFEAILFLNSPFLSGCGASVQTRGAMLHTLCALFSKSTSHVLKFLDPDRPHVKSGILSDLNSRGYLMYSNPNIEEAIWLMLYKLRLNQDALMKLDVPPISGILEEDDAYERRLKKNDKAAAQAASEAPEAKENSEDSFDVVETPVETEVEEDNGPEEADETVDAEAAEAAEEAQGPSELDVALVAAAEAAGMDVSAQLSELSDVEKEHMLVALEAAGGSVGGSDKDLFASMKADSIMTRAFAGRDLDDDDEEEVDSDEEEDALKPFKNDLEYLELWFQVVRNQIDGHELENSYAHDPSAMDPRTAQRIRELETKVRVGKKKIERRLALSEKDGKKGFVPRLEKLCRERSLCDTERDVLLILLGNTLMPNTVRFRGNVGHMLELLSKDLAQQIAMRRFFYKSSTLVKEGFVSVNALGFESDLIEAAIRVDRRVLEYCCGLEVEFGEIIDGSHLYTPNVDVENVILPAAQKDMIIGTVRNFDKFIRARKELGFDDVVQYGAGVCLLFYGESGTGKTMIANAVATAIKKRVLLINFPSLGQMGDENLRFIFREAKINDAVLFFDECESMFGDRERNGGLVNLLLTEIERHDGLIIMATNRPADLDEAMHRRITLSVQFRQPDHLLRKQIWKTLMPPKLQLADDVDLEFLAKKFELTGGFIKNALLSALSFAVSRDAKNIVVTQEDMCRGATLQLKGRISMASFERRSVPDSGLDKLVLPDKHMNVLRDVVNFEKARSVLFAQWGFGESLRNNQGASALFAGPPGTGKSMAAQAIAFEIGRPLKIVNCAELLSKWVGESSKNIESLFEQASTATSSGSGTGLHESPVLVFDEAEGLFSSRTATTTSTDRYANIDIATLLYHVERYPGVVILTCNNADAIDRAFFRRIKFVVHFGTPEAGLRAKLWRQMIPAQAPLDKSVDFERLGRAQALTGGQIRSAVLRAASRAALRQGDDAIIKMKDLSYTLLCSIRDERMHTFCSAQARCRGGGREDRRHQRPEQQHVDVHVSVT